MSKEPLLLLTILVTSLCSFSQSVKVDDTLRVIQTNSEAFQLYGKDAYKMLEIGNSMLELSKQMQYERGKASSYNTIALAHMSLAEYEKSVEYFLKALEIYERISATKYVASMLNNMGVVYYYLEDHEQSLSYHLRTLNAREVVLDSAQIAKSLNNIGIAYKNLNQFEKALEFYQRALSIKQNLTDSSGTSSTLNNIGNVYLSQNRLSEARDYFHQSLQLDSLSGKYGGMATSYLNLGSTAFSLGQFDQAVRLLTKSIQLANEYEARQTRVLGYEKMGEVFEKKRDFEKAFRWKTKWIDLKDSLNSIANSRIISELTSKYENEKIKVENDLLKEREKSQEKQIEEQRLLIAISTILVGSLILSVFFILKSYRMRKLHLKWAKKNSDEIKRKNELISDQNKELSQINEAKNKMFAIMSHDIRAPFNNLISVIYMASNKMLSAEEIPQLLKEVASEANNVSDLIANILDWMKTQMNGLSIEKNNFLISPIADEIFSAYKQQANDKNVKFKNLNDDSITAFGDENLTKTIIRNLIANAIKYTENGSVSIASKKEDGIVHVSVIDSGVGISDENIQRIFSNNYFSTAGTSKEIGTGVGLILIKEFVVKNGGVLKIKSELDIGTTFTFSMPANKT